MSLSSFGASQEGKIAYEENGKTRQLHVDSDNDGKLDLLKVENSNTQALMRNHSDGSQTLDISKESNGEIIRAQATVKDGIATLSKVTTEKSNHGGNLMEDDSSQVSHQSDICKSKSPLEKIVASAKDIENKEAKEAAEGVLDETCSNVSEDVSASSAIESGVGNLLRSSFRSCLSDSKEISQEKKTASLAERDLYASDPKRHIYGIVSCSKGPLSVALQKDGKVGIALSSDKDLNQVAVIRSGVLKGILEKMGLSSDEAAKIFQECLATKVLNKSNSVSGSSFGSLVSKSGKTDATEGMKKEMEKSQVSAINAKLAETKIDLPSADDSSPRSLAQVAASQGDAAASSVARNQSSGLLGAANTIMGAISTPASASSTASTSNSSRTPASVGLGKSVVGTKVPSAKGAGGVGGDEYIAEEIDLTANANVGTRSASQRAESQSNKAKNQNPRRGPASAGMTDGDLGSGQGFSGGGAISANSGGGGSGFSGSGGGTAGPAARSNTRNAASSGGNGQNSSREEIITFFGGADYGMARQKLREPAFVKTLEDNKITVLDLSGNAYGAKRGEIIFLDQGDRFVRQK